MSRRVLLIGDKLSDRTAILDALVHIGGAPFPLERVDLLAAGLDRLSRDQTKQTSASECSAAIIVDLYLPDSSGIETFEQLFQATPHIPILVIAASHDERIARRALRHGARGYVLRARLDAYCLCKVLESMLERAANAEAPFVQRELAEITLNSIGDAVISVNFGGEVTYLNAKAEAMTGWRREEAVARPLTEVLQIVDGTTRIPVPNPLIVA
jgi:DNA-binding NarL/FixJ family response regulator